MSISFDTDPLEIKSHTIIRLPLEISQLLPSRGMVMVEGTINNIPFQAPLEPDGKGSHWFEADESLMEEASITIGQTISLEIEPISEWKEPEIPEDIKSIFTETGLINHWDSLTTKARWEWLRWIRSTNNPATRQKRIDVACSKFQKGDRRPCCFDSTRCTIPELSKSGVLLDSL